MTISKSRMKDLAALHTRMMNKLGIDELNFPFAFTHNGYVYMCSDYKYLGNTVLGIDAWVITWKNEKGLMYKGMFLAEGNKYPRPIDVSWREGMASSARPKERNMKKRKSHTVPEEWEF